MSKRNTKQRARAEPVIQKRTSNFSSMWLSAAGDSTLIGSNYTTLDKDPTFITGIRRISEMIGSMTIHLMENSPKGDIRIKNELSRKIDIEPYSMMSRKAWMQWIVETALLKGNSFVLPVINERGMIEDLIPMNPDQVIILEDDFGYQVQYRGKVYQSDELLKFMINPRQDKPFLGQPYTVVLKDVIQNLKFAANTKGEFMSGKYNPSLIVKVESNAGDLATKEGRSKAAEQYLESSSSGQPWIIPADLMEVVPVKPLTLQDIALHKSVEVDKQTVAGIIGVPAFYLGVGTFDKDEHNNFVSTKIMAISKEIEQTLTRGLLYDPDWYFKFNPRSLFAYSITELSQVFGDGYVKGYITGNETRDAMGLSPKEGLDELVILENFIPIGSIGDQKKLKGKEVNK